MAKQKINGNQIGTTGGEWLDWTPTFTAGTGTPTTVTTTVARYTQIGKTVHLRMRFTVTNKGTAAGWCQFTLPVTANTSYYSCGIGNETVVAGYACNVFTYDTTHAAIIKYDSSTVWTNTHVIALELTYEAA